MLSIAVHYFFTTLILIVFLEGLLSWAGLTFSEAVRQATLKINNNPSINSTIRDILIKLIKTSSFLNIKINDILLAPLRKYIKPFYGVDFTPMITLIILSFLDGLLTNLLL